MTHRSFVLSIATVGVVLLVGFCTDLGPRKVPPAMRDSARIEYRVQIVVDSVRVRELEAENLRLARTAASQIGRARKSDSLASDARQTADSIASAAYRAFKVEEKAQLWQEAAHTYRDAADAATMASKTKDSTLAVRDAQIVAKDEVVSTERTRRERAESRVAQLEPLAMRGDDCKIIGFITCPTRKQSAIAASLLTLGALLAARR